VDTDKTKTLISFPDKPAKQTNPSSLRRVNLDYSRVEVAADAKKQKKQKHQRNQEKQVWQELQVRQ